MAGIFGNSMGLMKKSMDFLWMKETVHAANIANVDTPGYKAKYVTFEEEFAQKLQKAAGSGKTAVADAIEDTEYQIHSTDPETARLDGNNVNADSELIEMTRTALQYQYAQNAFNGEVSRLRTVIQG